jgi:transposase-like protein
MPRPKHASQDPSTAWLAEDPTRTYGDSAAKFGVNPSQVTRWYQLAQEKHGKVAYPPRLKVPSPAAGRKPKPQQHPNLVVLPPPVQRVAPPDIAAEFRGATLLSAKRIHEIAKDPKLSLTDAIKILELTTGTFALASAMEVKDDKADDIIEQLLGTAPIEQRKTL